ncbi:MAG: hypothetical protein Q7J78_06545 [Clostridiales bacterium]|nr:hypothetical protein [Clostridiales bacterium]
MTSGFVPLKRNSKDDCFVIPKGQRMHTLNRESYSEYIESLSGVELMKYALSAYWHSIYSCFRPEHGGFSNNAISVNCHVIQQAPMEIIAWTRKHESGISPLDMYRYTIERAIMEGGGYGYWRNLYYDSDSILLSGVGRIYQIERDDKWLKRIEQGIAKAID